MEKLGGNLGQEKYVENDEQIKECARSDVMLDGEMSKFVDDSQGVAQGCASSPNVVKVYINDLMVAIEAARQ